MTSYRHVLVASSSPPLAAQVAERSAEPTAKGLSHPGRLVRRAYGTIRPAGSFGVDGRPEGLRRPFCLVVRRDAGGLGSAQKNGCGEPYESQRRRMRRGLGQEDKRSSALPNAPRLLASATWHLGILAPFILWVVGWAVGVLGPNLPSPHCARQHQGFRDHPISWRMCITGDFGRAWVVTTAGGVASPTGDAVNVS